jgi:hypothetical protein
MSPRCVQIKEIEQYQLLLEDMDVPVLNAFVRSHTLTGQCRQIEKGARVVVEQPSLRHCSVKPFWRKAVCTP